ncbi:MAG: glutamate 5-kinase, partial [Chloroflexi bacterium]|nr:glutamate 5-kinase [Chloroflexota bacterium]
ATRPQHLARRQVLAAVGQARLFAYWDQLFEERAITAAQALLARTDLVDRQGYLNARNTLLALLELDVVPVVNENDVVSIEEIQDSVIGDNDHLSAQVANLVDADLLLILTDTDGLYTSDPAHDPQARRIERVEAIDAAIEAAARGQPGRRGTGGMVTKVEAARLATQSGAHVVIAHGRAEGVVARAAEGAAVGTHFLPTADRLESRRRYLLSSLRERGRITVDDGAVRALVGEGTSLLPAGVVGAEGGFERGHVVRIQSRAGLHVASGTANYAALDIERIRGLHSDRIEEVLGYDYGDEVVHRNNLVLL